MKASELIIELQEMIDEHGDGMVLTHGYYSENEVEEVTNKDRIKVLKGFEDTGEEFPNHIKTIYDFRYNVFFLDPGSYP